MHTNQQTTAKLSPTVGQNDLNKQKRAEICIKHSTIVRM